MLGVGFELRRGRAAPFPMDLADGAQKRRGFRGKALSL